MAEKPRFKAKSSSFDNNCGFHCIAHHLLNKMISLEEKKLNELFQQTGYQGFLTHFKEFYKIPKDFEVKPEKLRALFIRYSNPIDREVILGPVLRTYFIQLLKCKVDGTKGNPSHEIWKQKSLEFTQNPSALTSPEDLYLLAERMGIHLGYCVKDMGKPKFINTSGSELILHNYGNHWEFEVEFEPKEHNSCYMPIELLNAILQDPKTNRREGDQIARSSGAVFWGIIPGTTRTAASIKEEIRKAIHDDICQLKFDQVQGQKSGAHYLPAHPELKEKTEIKKIVGNQNLGQNKSSGSNNIPSVNFTIVRPPAPKRPAPKRPR